MLWSFAPRKMVLRCCSAAVKDKRCLRLEVRGERPTPQESFAKKSRGPLTEEIGKSTYFNSLLGLSRPRIVNVYSGEVIEGNVAISGQRIAYVGPSDTMVGSGTKVVDVGGLPYSRIF